MALRTYNEPEWKKYLIELGIPEEFAKRYASNFVAQQVSPDLLRFITDAELRDTYGVKLGGHRLMIMHRAGQPASQPQMITTSNRPQVRHQAPQLQPKMTPSSFRAFQSHWTVYKQLVGMSPNSVDAAAQIFSLACHDLTTRR